MTPFEILEAEFGVKFRKKSDLWLMRFVAWFLNLLPTTEAGWRGDRFMSFYATTYRLPFQKIPYVAHPDHWDVTKPVYRTLWLHEKVHAESMETSWGLFWMFWFLWLLPLPVVFSGRWFIERRAFLVDIRHGRMSPELAADLLWNDYLWAWPKSWAVEWWKGQLARENNF